jgi:hypothetical protein
MARGLHRDPEGMRYEEAYKRMMLGAGCDMATAAAVEYNATFFPLWDATPSGKMPECRPATGGCERAKNSKHFLHDD